MSRRTQPPAWLWFAAVDGIPVSAACLSARGARKAVQRVRKRHPTAQVVKRAFQQEERS